MIKISILLPVYKVDTHWLRICINSVLDQTYKNWELCIVDDYSNDIEIKNLIIHYAKYEKRIKFFFRNKNGGIANTSNDCFNLATGKFVTRLDHDDKLAINALEELSKVIKKYKDVDLIYTDEDKIDINENRHTPHFKPDWSPEYLETCNYISHLDCYRSSLIKKIGGFKSKFNGAQDYDCALKISEIARRIIHIPKILYHWRTLPNSTATVIDETTKPHAMKNAKKALEEHAKRQKYNCKVKISPFAGAFELEYDIKKKSKVSIIITSKGDPFELEIPRSNKKKVNILENCLDSIYKKTSYKNFEIILVVNEINYQHIKFKFIEKNYKNIQIYSYNKKYNFSQKNNFAVSKSNGEYLVFVNDDIQIIEKNWIQKLLSYCQKRHIGAVGAKLIHYDDTVQHNGVAFSNGRPDHIFFQIPKDQNPYFFCSFVNRNCLAVTAALMMIKKNNFTKVKGFDEVLGNSWNDTDLCLKLVELGKRNLVIGATLAYHFGSMSRTPTDKITKEWSYFYKKWRLYIEDDPYYNNNIFLGNPPNFKIRDKFEKIKLKKFDVSKHKYY